MRLTVALVLLVAAAQAAEVKQSSRSRQKEELKTDKRELAEGNAALEKRAPVLPTALPSVTPGIEYADSKESQPEKSPQQVYSNSLPIAKISDLLTAQGPPFQAAIASQLLAPVSVYQPRLAAPTTYEVSSPIASQLAYSEHKISYQPPQNAIQYQPVQYNQKLQAPKQANFARPINFHQPYQQQIFVQPQPVVYSQQPQLVPLPQPVQYQQIQQIPFQVQRPLQYNPQNVFPQHFVSHSAYNNEQQSLVQVAPSAQPGITYAREESNEEEKNEQASRDQLKSSEQPEETPKAPETQTPTPEKNYNAQPGGAVSYASFSQSQPAPSFAQPLRLQAQPQQYQVQPQQFQAQAQQYQVQPQQYQAQPQQYQAQPQQYQAQPQQYQAQPQQYQAQLQHFQPQPQPFQIQPLFHNQPQPNQPSQYEIQIQYQTPQNAGSKPSQETIATASSKNLPVNPQRPIAYFRPGPVLQNLQPQYQPPSYPHGRQVLLQNPGHAAHSLQAAPSFPPVQYFGKFAQSIFGGVQH